MLIAVASPEPHAGTRVSLPQCAPQMESVNVVAGREELESLGLAAPRQQEPRSSR